LLYSAATEQFMHAHKKPGNETCCGLQAQAETMRFQPTTKMGYASTAGVTEASAKIAEITPGPAAAKGFRDYPFGPFSFF
jgi:hypothetical protein